MPEAWLLLINEAINSLSKNLIRDRNTNACPYCDSRIVKNGTLCGRQRYQCKDCGRTFTCTVNTILYRSRTDVDIWKEVLADTLTFVSIDKTAERLGLSHDHVFHMHHKILAAMKHSEATNSTRKRVCNLFCIIIA